MTTAIDVTGYNMTDTLAKERRRLSEVELCEGMNELDTMLLPFALAVARLSARVPAQEPEQ